MPLIDITYPREALSASVFETLADELLTVAVEAEGAPNTVDFRSISAVYAHEPTADSLYTTGVFARRPVFRVDITCHAFLLTTQREKDLIKKTTRAVLTAAGHGDEAADSVWVLIHDVPPHHWGVGGQTGTDEDIRRVITDAWSTTGDSR
ncbi:tautomerase family protein [Nocardia transvalensis]|uniref:tautomerase family protein n=1 Tax=Nocardia transvalensis TaxID=37333 RepID=UPI0018938ED0|nr:tautomerase family protein [Nocardia transvalensis]MBF6331086.1 tautomerase family protein [Nocardia transvalensis]